MSLHKTVARTVTYVHTHTRPQTQLLLQIL